MEKSQNTIDFIASHSDADPDRLLLSRSKWPDVDMDVVVNTLRGRERLRRKLPSWFSCGPSSVIPGTSSVIPGTDRESQPLLFPTELCTQQCSGEQAALYKAYVASSLPLEELRSLRSLRPLPTSPASSLRENLYPSGPSPCPCPGVDMSSRGNCWPQGQGKCPQGSDFGRCGRPWPHEWEGPNRQVVRDERSEPVRSYCLADLTGGLGVDSWAFSGVFESVLYNEANPVLAAAAEHNFKILGRNNIVVSSKLLVPGNLGEILGDFKPDVIFLDPARRSSTGKKVFLLEDCQPDVLQLKDELLAACPNLLLKLSPMADISMLLQRLNAVGKDGKSSGQVFEIHVVAFDGECKELLVCLKRDWSGPHSIILHEDGTTIRPFLPVSDVMPDPSQVPAVMPDPSRVSAVMPDTDRASDMPFRPSEASGGILYEPGKSLLKAGIFDYPCTLGYKKLARHTHLYIAPKEYNTLDSYQKLPGKYFRIDKILPLQSKTLKELAKSRIAAEVSTHNIPIKAEDLKKRLHATSSPSAHLFAARVGTADYLIFTIRL